MKAGTLLLVIKDVITLMESAGIVLPTGEFDETKLDSLQEDAAFAAAVAGILEAHGVNVPDRVENAIRILPLLAAFIR